MKDLTYLMYLNQIEHIRDYIKDLSLIVKEVEEQSLLSKKWGVSMQINRQEAIERLSAKEILPEHGLTADEICQLSDEALSFLMLIVLG